MEENENIAPENENTSSQDEQVFHQRTDLSELRSSVETIKSEVAKIVEGQHKMVELIIAAILADGHVLLEGVPGVAKTLTAKIISKTLSADFSRLQFTPDLMPSDVIGTSVFNMKTSEFEFKQGPIFSNIVLIDEINRSPAKTQAALFEVMEEKQITVDGNTYELGTPFFVISTQNPIEQEGTYRLPEAQLDRFLFKINVDYPSLAEELNILKGYHSRSNKNDLSVIQKVLSVKDLIKYRQKVADIHIDDNLMHYIAQIVNQTRDNNFLYLGASPRASIAIMTGSKAISAMRGRDFVTPEDIKEVAYPVLGHRIALTPEKEMEGVEIKEVVERIIEGIEIPR